MPVGEAVVDVHRRLRLAVADDHPQVHQLRRLIEQRRRGRGVAFEFHHLDTGVHQIVEDDLPAAVGALLEVAVEDRMGRKQRVQRIGQPVDVDLAPHVGRETDEVVGLGEHLLAAGQLADTR